MPLRSGCKLDLDATALCVDTAIIALFTFIPRLDPPLALAGRNVFVKAILEDSRVLTHNIFVSKTRSGSPSPS
jgi:hypothetical protein